MDQNRPPVPAYRHRQPGTLIRRVLLGIGVVESGVLIWLLIDDPSAELLLVALVMVSVPVAVFVLAGSLSVTVDAQRVRVVLGAGLVRRTIPIAEIAACDAVRNSWWYGWGIRLTPRGWLWNVSGLDAVELTYRSGKHFRIGTDQPEQLCAAIADAIRREAGG